MKRIAVFALACLVALPAAAAPGDKSTKRARKTAAERKAQSILNTLQTRRLTVQLESATLDQFVKYLRTAGGVNIVVKRKQIEKDGGDPDGIEIDLSLENVRMIDAIKIALEAHELGYAIKGNVFIITSKKDARGKPLLRIYSVAHLLVPIRDFPAPDVNIYPSSYEPPEPPEPEIQRTFESSEELAELVRQFTGKDTWEDEGISITVFRNHLFIRTYPGVHAEVGRFLAQLPR
jgi:hypothetical protein